MWGDFFVYSVAIRHCFFSSCRLSSVVAVDRIFRSTPLRENLSKKKSGEGERSGIRVERQEKGRRKERKREDSKG